MYSGPTFQFIVVWQVAMYSSSLVTIPGAVQALEHYPDRWPFALMRTSGFPASTGVLLYCSYRDHSTADGHG